MKLDNLKQFLYSKLKKYKVILIIMAILAVGVFYKNNEKNVKQDVIASERKMTAPNTMMINTGLYNKTLEQKRKFLLTDYSMDYLIGDKYAKVSIIDYSSITCRYCKKMRQEINKIIDEYVIEKKVANYALRPLYNTKTIPFGAFIQCAKEENKREIMDIIFNTDIDKLNGNLESFLIDLSKKFSMNEEYVKDCIYNEEMYQKLIYMQQESSYVFDIKATPVLIINGTEYVGYKNYQQLKEIIDRLL